MRKLAGNEMTVILIIEKIKDFKSLLIIAFTSVPFTEAIMIDKKVLATRVAVIRPISKVKRERNFGFPIL